MPPRVHHTLKELILPIALVPIVFITPDKIFTPQAIAAISTRVSVRPRPTSARDAKYSATLFSGSPNQIFQFRPRTYIASHLKFPDVPEKTIAMEYIHPVQTPPNEYMLEISEKAQALTANNRQLWFHFANPKVQTAHSRVCAANLG